MSSPTGVQTHDEMILFNRQAAVDQLDIERYCELLLQSLILHAAHPVWANIADRIADLTKFFFGGGNSVLPKQPNITAFSSYQ